MKRVVITGIGAITSLGNNGDEIISSLHRDRTAFRRSDLDKDLVVCPIEDFELKSYTGRFKNSRYLTRGAAFALAAAIEAVKDAGIPSEQLRKAGVFVGSGPNLDIGNEFPNIENSRIRWDKHRALWILKFLPNTAASAIGQYLSINGESASLGTACAASLQAIGTAFQKIKWGEHAAVLAGGGDSRLSPGALMAYKKAGALYKGRMNPDQACRPFDRDRNGFVCGEGGAFLFLEELDHAKKRGAHIYAEICGFASTADGYAMAAPRPDGKFAKLAVEMAIEQAEMDFHDIGLVSAHGTSTRLNDAVEGELLSSLFKPAPTLVMGLKSWIGHLSAACGAVELAISLFCAKERFVPAIRNIQDPCADAGFVAGDSARLSPGAILMENFGFGGQNCAMVVRPWHL